MTMQTITTTAAHGVTPTDAGPHHGPARRLEGAISVADESAIPSPYRAYSAARITLEIAEDGRGVLTVRHPDQAPSATVDLPAEVARELDRVLFGGERGAAE